LNTREKHTLRSQAREFGVALSQNQLDLLGIYLEELLEWNRKMNLAGLSSRERILRELLLDSLIPTPFLPGRGWLLDVGTGAGFPAIPIKICKPGLGVHLLEANRKKAHFLKQVIRLTKLGDTEVLLGRVDEGAHLLRPEGYHVVTARALAPLPRTLAWCGPHLGPGGLLVTFLGGSLRGGLDAHAHLVEAQGLSLLTALAYSLPGKAAQRHLLIFKKSIHE
jgi:16S rRNA (guanine527-N7)-methyltransferase